MLTDMGKSFIDSSGVSAYEEAKAETHRRIKERHHRHQVKRKRMKHEEAAEAAPAPEETVAAAAGENHE